MEKANNERQADHLDDEFEVIELGSVSEETEGGINDLAEFGGAPNSRM